MSEPEWDFGKVIAALLVGTALIGLGLSLIEEHKKSRETSAQPTEPRLYEVHCEGPNGWEEFTVDFNSYGGPRSFRQGGMRFETTQGVKVHGSNCIAKHPAEWRR